MADEHDPETPGVEIEDALRASGERGIVLAAPNGGSRPPAASERAILRGGLPSVFQDSDFGMRFIGSLETLLDPIVGVLDGLHTHFSTSLAPEDILDLMLAWLGVETPEGLGVEDRRALLREATELSRMRGTKVGLERALKLTFPGFPLRVEDQGQVTWSRDPDDIPKAKGADFVVYCDVPLKEEQMRAVARAIDHYKPVHTRYRLRVKAPRKAR